MNIVKHFKLKNTSLCSLIHYFRYSQLEYLRYPCSLECYLFINKRLFSSWLFYHNIDRMIWKKNFSNALLVSLCRRKLQRILISSSFNVLRSFVVSLYKVRGSTTLFLRTGIDNQIWFQTNQASTCWSKACFR